MPNTQNRTRLKFLEYKLLEAIRDGAKLDTTNKTITGLGSTPIPTIMEIANVLIERSFIKESGITIAGMLYLDNYPVPKVKYPQLFEMTSADIEYLNILKSSKHDWTRSIYLSKKSSMLFKIVRLGYAIAKKSGDKSKITKNEIVPKPSLTLSENRPRYSFKITKKGIDYLLSIK